MSKKLPLLSVFAAIFALCLMVASPALAHHDADHAQGGGNGTSTTTSEEHGNSSNGSENTPGNDRKEGYEDNSSTPQETNHGKGADNDGDADSDPNTSYTEDNDTNDGGTPNNVSDDGDNAHPSGKDRSVENGGSGNQGKSESNPDDSKGPMRYEGTQGDDKPNGPGGTDLADQDGNNGCGNDDDFDDDNNGWCGKPARTTTPPPKPPKDNKPCDANLTMPGVQKCETPTTVVLPGQLSNPPSLPCDKDNNMANGIQSCEEGPGTPPEVAPGLEVRPATPTDNVLGVRLSRAPAVAAAVNPAVTEAAPAVEGAVLPFTGGDMAMFLVAALGLIVLGGTALKVRRSES